MQRFAFWIIMALILVLLFLLFLKFRLPEQESTVYLKDASRGSIEGYVTKKDNYIIVTKGRSEQVFPWDEVKSIVVHEPLASETSTFSYWLDKLDFLSSLGVLAALLVFSVGLYQYQQGLLWKREEFLAGLLDSFAKSEAVQNAKQMMESLAQYEGDFIKLYPEKEGQDQSPYISNEEIIDSLRVPVRYPNDRVITIRQNFDTFLDYFETLEHYIQLRVVAKNSVYVQLSYWLNLLGRYDRLRENYRDRIINYAEHFQYEGFVRIIGRFNKGHRFWWKFRNKEKAEGPVEKNIKPKEVKKNKGGCEEN